MFHSVAHLSCSGVLAGKVILPVVTAYSRLGNPRCGYESDNRGNKTCAHVYTVRAVADLNGCTVTDSLSDAHALSVLVDSSWQFQVGACMSQRQNTKLLLQIHVSAML